MKMLWLLKIAKQLSECCNLIDTFCREHNHQIGHFRIASSLCFKARLSAKPGLCSSRARWPLAPNFCFWATRKSQIFHTNHMLGSLDFTGSEHWAPFNFPQSTALKATGMKMFFYSHADKTHFQLLVLSLILKVRFYELNNWPIQSNESIITSQKVDMKHRCNGLSMKLN